MSRDANESSLAETATKDKLMRLFSRDKIDIYIQIDILYYYRYTVKDIKLC